MKKTIATWLQRPASQRHRLCGPLVINTDTADPAPKKAFEYIIEKFGLEP